MILLVTTKLDVPFSRNMILTVKTYGHRFRSLNVEPEETPKELYEL